MTEYNLDKEGKKLVTKSGLNLENIEYDGLICKTVENAVPYVEVFTHCRICNDEFTMNNKMDIICPDCKETIKWLKENKNYLQKLIDKSN